MPVSSVFDEMTSAEVAEWQAYRQVELLPGERLEMLVATLIALTANIHRAEHSEPLTALDFLPWLQDDDDEDDERRPEDMIRMIETLNAAFGGRDLREPEPSTNARIPEPGAEGETDA